MSNLLNQCLASIETKMQNIDFSKFASKIEKKINNIKSESSVRSSEYESGTSTSEKPTYDSITVSNVVPSSLYNGSANSMSSLADYHNFAVSNKSKKIGTTDSENIITID